MATPRATFADKRETLQAALSSLFNGKPEDTAADLERLAHPDFRLQAEHEDLDYPNFVKHIRGLREMLPANAVTLDITQFLRDGNQVAERHSSTMTMPDGSVHSAETFFFAEIAEDGRLLWVKEQVRRYPTKGPDGKVIEAAKPEAK